MFSSSSFLTACLVIVLATTVFLCLHRRSNSLTPALPTPAGAEWIWGHERAVFMEEPGRAFRRWVQEVGLTFRIKAAFGAPDILILNDPSGVEHILRKRIYDYHHSKIVRPRVARLLGKGLGWVEGESEHKRMRRLISPSLSRNNVKDMSTDVQDAAIEVVNELMAQVLASKAKDPINILKWTAKATLNVIGRVAFLHDFEKGNSADARCIIDARREGVSPTRRYAGFLTLMLLRRFPILNQLPIHAVQAQGLVKTTIQSGVAHEMIRRNGEHVVDLNRNERKDLLSRLLIAYDQRKLSQQELYEQISTFVVSGHETTTQTLGFTIWELARHSEVQQRLRDELTALNRTPSYDDYESHLPYMDAVLRETLRLYPGLPYMERVASKPDVLPLHQPVRLSSGDVVSNIPVEPGQVVLIPIVAIHRLDSVWTDPDSFYPERWLGELPPQEQLCTGWSNLLAFSDGPRSCIGMHLAIYQYKVILTHLLTRFVFKDSGVDITLKVSSSLQPWVEGVTDGGPQLPIVLEAIA